MNVHGHGIISSEPVEMQLWFTRYNGLLNVFSRVPMRNTLRSSFGSFRGRECLETFARCRKSPQAEVPDIDIIHKMETYA